MEDLIEDYNFTDNFNFTAMFEEVEDHVETELRKWIHTVPTFINIKFGILANLFMFCKYFTSVEMRNETNAFIISIATFDLVLAVTMITDLVTIKLDFWPFGRFACDATMVVFLMLPFIHAFLLAIAAIINLVRAILEFFTKMDVVTLPIVAINTIVWIILTALGFLLVKFSEVYFTFETRGKVHIVCTLPRTYDPDRFFMNQFEEKSFFTIFMSFFVVTTCFVVVTINHQYLSTVESKQKKLQGNLKKIFILSFAFLLIFAPMTVAINYILMKSSGASSLSSIVTGLFFQARLIVLWINPIILYFLKH